MTDIPVPKCMLNVVAIDKVFNCKYLGHCINDKLIDDDDSARQRKHIDVYMHWYESFRCVQKPSECPRSNRIAPPCTRVRYGAIRCENYVLLTTMFFL